MDPEQAYTDLLEAIDDWEGGRGDDADVITRMITSFAALDSWLKRGGYFPSAWSSDHRIIEQNGQFRCICGKWMMVNEGKPFFYYMERFNTHANSAPKTEGNDK